MQQLGLNAAQHRTYIAHLMDSHNFRVSADVLNASGDPIQSIDETLLDGQVNIQRAGPVRRTATLTFWDPDRRLHLDADSPIGSTLFLDRMVRVRHTTNVPGIGRVTATPFVGPVTKVSRDGDTVAVECQDKAAFSARGRPPLTVKKGMNAVSAVRAIMAATGENWFRLPDQTSKRLPKAYSVGWSDDASPWIVASKIADLLGMQLLYSCDGFLTLRRPPKTASASFNEKQLTSSMQVEYDATGVYNTVRVRGTLKQKKKPKDSKKADAKAEKISVSATAKNSHPLSPNRLGRNGKDRYLPLLADGEEYKKTQEAANLAKRLLEDGLSQTSVGISLSSVPLFHLDADDVLSINTDSTSFKIRFSEGSIPLGVGGDMSIGYQRRVSGGRRG